jgi:hypothetical protein
LKRKKGELNMARRSGMNRKRFLQSAGVGAAGLGAAAMGMSGVAHAATPPVGVPVKAAIIYRREDAGYREAANTAAAVLEEAGIEYYYVQVNNNSDNAYNYTKALITGADIPEDPQFECVNAPYNVIISSLTSSLTAKVNNAIKDVGLPIEHVVITGTADDLNPLYPGSDYKNSSIYFNRTAVTSSAWGQVAASEADDSGWGLYTRFFIRRFERPDKGPQPAGSTDPDPAQSAWEEDKFGSQGNDGFDGYFGTPKSTVIYIDYGGTRFFEKVGDKAWTEIFDLGAFVGAGQKLFGAAMNTANAVNIVEKLRTLSNVKLATLGTVNSKFGNDTTQNTWLEANAVGTLAYYWVGSTSYNEWYADWENWYVRDPVLCPKSKPEYPKSQYTPRAFDAASLVVGGASNWTTNKIHQLQDEIERYSKSPGYDFQGASGPVDQIKGECSHSAFTLWVGRGYSVNVVDPNYVVWVPETPTY